MASGPDDELLLRLLEEHADGDGRWLAIEKGYNSSSTEKRSRMWLKNRAKKIAPQPSIASGPIVRASEPKPQSGCVTAPAPIITYDDFKKLVEEVIAGRDDIIEVENLYHKLKHLPREELRNVLFVHLGTKQQEVGSTLLVPGVRPSLWFASCMSKFPSEFEVRPSTLDASDTMHLIPMFRTQASKTVYHDVIHAGLVSSDSFAQNLGKAMRWLEQNTERDLRVEEVFSGGLLRVTCSACCAPARLAMPDFVRSMERLLGIDVRSEIIAVPYRRDRVYMANSASVMGCSALGDFVDAVDGIDRGGDNNFLFSVPFRVRSIDTSGLPASLLLAQGKTPVRWELYPFFGQNALLRPTSATGSFEFRAPDVDDVVRCPVPRSQAQAEAYLNFVKEQVGPLMGKKNKSLPPHVTIRFTPGRVSPTGSKLRHMWYVEDCMRESYGQYSWLVNGEGEPLAQQLSVCAECFLPLFRDKAATGRGSQTIALSADTLAEFAARLKVCTCGQVSYCSEACRQKHREIHANVCDNSCLGAELKARVRRRKCRAVLQNMTERIRNVQVPLELSTVTSWSKYSSLRGFSLTDLSMVSEVMSMPLTILFGMTKFEGLGLLQLAGRETLRVDVAGASALETLCVEEDAFAELAHAFPKSKIHLRLVGPALKVDSNFGLGCSGTDNLCVSCHKFLYEDFLASLQGVEDAHLPDIVVAPNAGLRESWYPAIQRVCDLSLPLMFTGYDFTDVLFGLQELLNGLPSSPRVVRDGSNPFAGASRGQKIESDLSACAKLGETDVGEVLRAADTSRNELIVRDLQGPLCVRVNSHYVLIHGYDVEER